MRSKMPRTRGEPRASARRWRRRMLPVIAGLMLGLTSGARRGCLLVLLVAVPAAAQTSPKSAPRSWRRSASPSISTRRCRWTWRSSTPTASAVTLGEFFDGRRPVILTLNYSNCPMLCSLQLNGLVDGIGDMQWDLGDQFQIVTVSIDPLGNARARRRLTKEKYLQGLRPRRGRPRLALPHRPRGEHPEAGRHGRVSLRYVPEDDAVRPHGRADPLHARRPRVALPLRRRSTIRRRCGCRWSRPAKGKIGSTLDQVLLYCFHYDAEAAATARPPCGSCARRRADGGRCWAALLSVFWIARVAQRKRSRGGHHGGG